MPTDAREITTAVDLQLADGTLDPAAVGWTRTPLHRTDQVGHVRARWGRAKRWEYWAAITAEHVVGLTVSSLDYAGLAQLWLLDRRTGEQVDQIAVVPLAHGTVLPGTLGAGPASARSRHLAIALTDTAQGTRLRAATRRVQIDLVAELPAGHERLGVVVPWDARTFQYTVKDVARPLTGTITLDGHTCTVAPGTSWATLDHGRGYWPRELAWNWGFGAGVSHGRTVGLQLGGRWTDGTGSTENALVVDGRLHKLRTELRWSWTPGRWTDPWHVHGDGVDLTFTPFVERVARTDLWLVRSSTHQCFGTWSGSVRDEDGTDVLVEGVEGSAEDVEQRW